MNIHPLQRLTEPMHFQKQMEKQEAIVEAEKLNLADNHFYFVLLGELYKDIDNDKARMNFQKALLLAKTKTDQHTIQNKLDNLA